MLAKCQTLKHCATAVLAIIVGISGCTNPQESGESSHQKSKATVDETMGPHFQILSARLIQPEQYIKATAVLTNSGKRSVSIVNHPDFLEMKVFLKGAEQRSLLDGVHYQNISTNDVSIVKPGESIQIECASPWGADRSRNGLEIKLVLHPASDASLPSEIVSKLKSEDVTPLNITLHSKPVIVEPIDGQ